MTFAADSSSFAALLASFWEKPLPIQIAWTVLALWASTALLRFSVDLLRGKAYYGGVPTLVDLFGVHYVTRVAYNYHRVYDFLLDLWHEFSRRTYTIKAPFVQRYYVTMDSKNVEYVLKTNFNNYVRGPRLNECFHQLLGGGIFNNDGAAWHTQRKTASNIFTVKNFRDFFLDVFRDESNKLALILRKAALHNEVIDLHDLFHRYTLDSFMRIAFGVDLHILDSFLEGEKKPVAFAAAFDAAQRITDARIFNPFWKVTEWLDSSSAVMKEAIKVMDQFAYDVVQSRRQDPRASEYSDLLSRFLTVKADDTGRLYTDQELRDIVMNMVIAGRDTTAQALSWTIFRLTFHPDVRQTIRDEISNVFGSNPDFVKDASLLTYETVKDMEFLHATFSEVLRLHPSVPKQGKTALQDDVLPDGTHVPAGSLVAWSSYGMGRCKELWGDDAEVFDPQRFIKDPNPSQFKFLSFNAGPRLCLGMNMAYIEGITALTVLLNEFDFALAVPEKQITYQNGLTLSMRHGLPVRVMMRK